MSGRAVARWRSAVLGLWLVSTLLPLLPPSPHEALPPCCRDDGKHQCSLRERPGSDKSAGSLTASCAFNAPAKATGARVTALQPDLPRMSTRQLSARRIIALTNDVAPAAAVIHRPSRAPPRLLV